LNNSTLFTELRDQYPTIGLQQIGNELKRAGYLHTGQDNTGRSAPIPTKRGEQYFSRESTEARLMITVEGQTFIKDFIRERLIEVPTSPLVNLWWDGLFHSQMPVAGS